MTDIEQEVYRGRMPIYIDRGSIHAAILKLHPEIERSDCYLSSSAGGPFAWVTDTTACTEGKECTIASDHERESYYGLQIGIMRWKDK